MIIPILLAWEGLRFQLPLPPQSVPLRGEVQTNQVLVFHRLLRSPLGCHRSQVNNKGEFREV